MVEELESHFEKNKTALIENLKLLMKYLFRPENMIVSVTAEPEGLSGLMDEALELREALYRDEVAAGKTMFELEQKNEAFKTSGQVQYVAAAGNFLKSGYEYTGALRILRTILNYDYLWMNLRVKGGAYRMLGMFQRSGTATWYPTAIRISKEPWTYTGPAEYLREFQAVTGSDKIHHRSRSDWYAC